MKFNYYEILNISSDSELIHIEEACQKIIKRCKDNYFGDNSEYMKLKIESVFKMLSDPKKRLNYDLELKETEKNDKHHGGFNKPNIIKKSIIYKFLKTSINQNLYVFSILILGSLLLRAWYLMENYQYNTGFVLMVIALVLLGLVILSSIIIYFYFYTKNKNILESISPSKKFYKTTEILNKYVFAENGHINEKEAIFQLYEEKMNHLIDFEFHTCNLIITWRYKYYQKEMIYTKIFKNVDNITVFQTQNIAKTLITEMEKKIHEHKMKIFAETKENLLF